MTRLSTKRWMTLLTIGLAAGLIGSLHAADEEQRLLERTSSAFTQLAKRSMPAVVSIQVEKTVEVGGRGGGQYPFNDPFDLFGDEFLRRFFRGRGGPPQQQPRRRQFRQEGAGSGFLISKDGYILSNNHVVGDADKITVKLNDGREFEAERIGTDPKSEVALIKIEGDDFPVLPLGDSANIQVGEWVVAIGNPFGLTQTLTVGVISAKGRSNIGIADYEDFIQTDAAINPGNSGGPLLNIQGKVIGINTAIYSRSGGYMGIGFAIPINMAVYVKEQLLEKGKVDRSFLGVVIQPVTSELAESFGLDDAEGILISQVAEDTGAEEAGLQSGDIILELNGKAVSNIGRFRNTIAANPPGTELTLTILREGDRQEVQVTTGTLPDEEMEVSRATEDIATDLGLAVQELTPELANRLGYEMDEGVLISEVEYGSEAAAKGLQPGTLIKSVNRTPVSSLAAFRKALAAAAEGGRILLHVKSDRGARFVVLSVK